MKKNISKKNKYLTKLKYIFTKSEEKLDKAYDVLFNETLKIENSKTEFNTLYEYYKIQYPKDLEIFRDTCSTDKYSTNPKDKLFFIDDLHNFRKSNHYLLKKKHFVYLLAIHTAFLMTAHKYFNDKYEEFKTMNKGIVFEYGLTNTFVYPWKILKILLIPFDKKLFSDCLGRVMSDMMIDNHFCGITPRDFMDKFIDDLDLNDPRTLYGKHWKEIVTEEWFQSTRCICPKKL